MRTLDNSALILALQNGHKAIVRLLLGTKNKKETAFMLAAAGGHEEICRLLVSYGAAISGASK